MGLQDEVCSFTWITNKVEFWINEKHVHIGIKVFSDDTESGKQPMVLGFNAPGGPGVGQIGNSILSVFGCGRDGEIWFPDPLLLEENGAKNIMDIQIEKKAANLLNKWLCKWKPAGDKQDCKCTYKKKEDRLECQTKGVPYSIIPFTGDHCLSILRRIFGDQVYNSLVDKVKKFESAKPPPKRPQNNYSLKF